jgi:NADH-quinone oxidoreductase subunit J
LKITPELITFGGLAGAAALCAVGVVAFRNAVRSALCLVLNFFLLAFLYFTLNAEMLGITQIVVYTGAIMVLFLFVIMLLNLGAPQVLEEKKDIKMPIGIGLGVALAAVIASQVIPALIKTEAMPVAFEYGQPEKVGHVLFTTYVLPFEAVSILLLIGIVGSILLAKRRIS